MSKQDGYASRTAADLERRCNFGQTFAEVYGLVSDARKAAEEAQAAVESLDQEEIFNRLTNYGESEGIYRDENGNVYVNASYIRGGKLAAEYIDADNLEVNAANINGTLEAYQIDVDNLEVLAANITGYIKAYQLELSGSLTFDEGGYLGYCYGYSSHGIGIMDDPDTGQCICTASAVRMSYGGDSSVYCNYLGVHVDGANGIYFDVGGSTAAYIDDTALRPNSAGGLDLGTSYFVFDNVFCNTCTAETSDANKKNSIEELPQKYLALFDNLTPKRFKMNSGTSGRFHVGYIAQEVKEAMDKAGIESAEFGGWIKDQDEDGNDIFMLRYGEFGAIYAAKIKQLESRLAAVERSLA